jgi:hypothetical protein
LDPFGAALAALGLAVALRAASEHDGSRVLLAGMLAADAAAGHRVELRPAVADSRVCAAAVPLALLAGAGFEALRTALSVAPLRRPHRSRRRCARWPVSGISAVRPRPTRTIMPALAPSGIVLSELGHGFDAGDAVCSRRNAVEAEIYAAECAGRTGAPATRRAVFGRCAI